MTATNKTKHKYLIGMTYVAEDVDNEAPYCIVEISEETAKSIFGWMRKFERGGPLEGAAYVQVFNYAATFVSRLNKVIASYEDDCDVVVSFDELLTHPDSLAMQGEGGPVARTEMDLMSISDDHVRWRANFKHSEHEVEGPGLTRKQLEELLVEFEKAS